MSVVMEKKSKGGRPAGSRNREYVVVYEYPAQCPSCGSTNIKPIPGGETQVHEFPGIDAATGKPFDRVTWRNCRCECGQVIRRRRPEKTMTDS